VRADFFGVLNVRDVLGRFFFVGGGLAHEFFIWYKDAYGICFSNQPGPASKVKWSFPNGSQ